MAKYIYAICLLVLSISIVNCLKCITYTCGSHGGLSCSPLQHAENVTCGNPLIGYQNVCSYVATDDPNDGGYRAEGACDLVPVGKLNDVFLKRCIDKDLKLKVVHCKICNTDLCNTPPRR